MPGPTSHTTDATRDYRAPAGVPSPDEPRDLVFYTSTFCPYCRRVQEVIDHLELNDAMKHRDTTREPEARADLQRATGRRTVPCLFIDDVPFFESARIIEWLKAYAARGDSARA